MTSAPQLRGSANRHSVSHSPSVHSIYQLFWAILFQVMVWGAGQLLACGFIEPCGGVYRAVGLHGLGWASAPKGHPPACCLGLPCSPPITAQALDRSRSARLVGCEVSRDVGWLIKDERNKMFQPGGGWCEREPARGSPIRSWED